MDIFNQCPSGNRMFSHSGGCRNPVTRGILWILAFGRVRRNMPEPILVMILGRLAVDQQWQGKQIGAGMRKDAILRTLIAAEQAGIRALLVHALSEQAKRFYLQCGFHESPVNDMTLMITLAEARNTISG